MSENYATHPGGATGPLTADLGAVQQVAQRSRALAQELADAAPPQEPVPGAAALLPPGLSHFLTTLGAARARHHEALADYGRYFAASAESLDGLVATLDEHEQAHAAAFNGR